MEEIPNNNEQSKNNLLDRIEKVRSSTLSDVEKMLAFNEEVLIFKRELQDKYTREVLRCLPQWHGMIGSSVDTAKAHGGEDAIDADIKEQILTEISEFISRYEQAE